jgi:hypothetical protein
VSNPSEPQGLAGRRAGDFILFGATALEMVVLFLLTPKFAVIDWIYVWSNLLVLLIALTRRPAKEQDCSLASGAAVIVSYGYPYAQVALLRSFSGHEAWLAGGWRWSSSERVSV